MMNNLKINFSIICIFIILSSNISLAQEPSQETPTLDSSDLELSKDLPTQEEPFENPITGNGHNESTYYMNTRPADFIQVINTNGTIINETYIYLQDKLIAKYDTNGRKFFYHPDHLGSTSLVTNESGDVVEDLLYLPYGDVLSGTEISRFGYTGQENDLESGFMDYGARQYDARFSRFIQPDPVISDIYNPQNLNRYAYVLNNPYKYVDPDGRIILPVLVVVGVVWAIDVGVGLFHGGNEGKNFIQSYGVGVQEAGDHFGRAATTAEGAGEFAFNFVGGEVATKIIGKFSKAESIGKISRDPKVKSDFLKSEAEAQGAIEKYSKEGVEAMKEGKNPSGFQVHHKEPLYAGDRKST